MVGLAFDGGIKVLGIKAECGDGKMKEISSYFEGALAFLKANINY